MDYHGIFWGDAPQFIMLSLVAGFWIGYFTFAHRSLINVDPRHEGFYSKQMKRVRFVKVLLIISFALVTVEFYAVILSSMKCFPTLKIT
jgi:hypothetical protein